jgi:hypothetical protein
MAEGSSSKRRRSPSPSPLRSDLATNASTSTTMRPPEKKGKSQSLEENPLGEGSSRQYQNLSTGRYEFLAQPEQGPSARNQSRQSMSFPGMGIIERRGDDQGGTRPTPYAMRGPPPPTAPTTPTTRFGGPGPMLPQDNQHMTPEGGPLATENAGTSAFMNDFVFDAMSLSPLSFPPAPPNPIPEANRPDLQATTPQSHTYPEITPMMETGFYGQQTQAQDISQSAFAPAVQEAYPLPTETSQAPQSQVPTTQVPANMPSGVQQGTFPLQYQTPGGQPQMNECTALRRDVNQQPLILQNMQTQQSAPPQAAAQTIRTPIIPIEPIIVSEHYLWTQLEAAQVTMVGTLVDLVMRNRREELGLQVGDQQVENVTRNLINVMSLWYTLRVERGWPT